jgi:hypothetical protein
MSQYHAFNLIVTRNQTEPQQHGAHVLRFKNIHLCPSFFISFLTTRYVFIQYRFFLLQHSISILVTRQLNAITRYERSNARYFRNSRLFKGAIAVTPAITTRWSRSVATQRFPRTATARGSTLFARHYPGATALARTGRLDGLILLSRVRLRLRLLRSRETDEDCL